MSSTFVADQLLRRVAEHPLGRRDSDTRIEPSGPSSDDDVVGPLDQRAEVLLAADQLGLEAGALDRVAERARQVLAVGLALDQVVLRAVLHGATASRIRAVAVSTTIGIPGAAASMRPMVSRPELSGRFRSSRTASKRDACSSAIGLRQRAAPLDVDLRRRTCASAARRICGIEVVVFDEQDVGSASGRHAVTEPQAHLRQVAGRRREVYSAPPRHSSGGSMREALQDERRRARARAARF